MDNILVALMSQLTSLTEEETLAIEESFPIKTFIKGTYLLQEGQVATDAYFVVKGCIRTYKLVDGNEKTIDFFTENQSVANFSSLANETPSKYFLVCMEDTTVAIVNSVKELELYRKHPRFETFCRSGMEQMMGSQQDYFSEFMMLSPKERYLNLLNEKPDLIQRVPQYQLASYLGIEPETLSRIRKQIMGSR
jgi:CRP-like cAMP-binding protein